MSVFFDQVARLQEQIDALDVILSGDDAATVTVGGVSKPSVSRDIKLRLAQIQAMVQGSLAYETKAEMDAAGAPPSGELARVWKDATESNNGIYGYSGGAWVKSIYDPEQYVDNRLKNQMLLPNGLYPVLDRSGVLGAANTLYLPRKLYFQQGSAVSNQDVANAESAILPGYSELTISSGSSVAFVYYDRTDNSYKSAIYSGGIDLQDAKKGDAIPVFMAWGEGVWSLWDYKDADDKGSQHVLLRKGPMIIEGDTLYVPEFYVYGSDLGFVLLSPSSGRFFELPASTESSIVHTHYVDMAAVKRGETPEDSIKTVTAAGGGYLGGFNNHTIAKTIGRQLTTPYPAAGDVPGGRVPNLCPHGKVADGLDRVYGSTEFVDVTDPDLLAMGLTRGFTDNSGTRPYAGMEFPDKRGGGRAFFRFCIETATPDEFGIPVIYVWSSTGVLLAAYPALEKKLSSTAAIYSASFLMPNSDDLLFFYVGAEQGNSAGLTICGVQFYHGELPGWWIRRDDYPSDVPLVSLLSQISGDVANFNIAYPSDMFLVSGRPLPLYPVNICQERSEGTAFETVFWSEGPGAANGYYPYVVNGRSSILIDPDKCAGSAGIEMRRHGDSFQRTTYRYGIPLTVHVAPEAQAGTVRVLSIGDSLTNRDQPMLLGRKLEHMGLTVEMIGTMDNGGSGSYNGEAREGREWADFIYEHTDSVAPVADGTEAVYLASSNNNKLTSNPFLKVPDSNDTDNKAGYIYNGYIFDMAYYLQRFGFADPDFVTINLGTNDVSQQDEAETLAQVQRGFEVIYNQTREALPNAHIGILVNTLPRSSGGDNRWASDRFPTLIVEQMKLVKAARDAGDSKVWFVPCYAHMSQETGWPQNILETDPNTGMVTIGMPDQIHFERHGREQYAEAVTAWVAALYAGV